MNKPQKRLSASLAALVTACLALTAPSSTEAQPLRCWSICVEECPTTYVCGPCGGGQQYCDDSLFMCPLGKEVNCI